MSEKNNKNTNNTKPRDTSGTVKSNPNLKERTPKNSAKASQEKKAANNASNKEEIMPSLKVINQIIPVLLALFALYLIIAYIFTNASGFFGKALKNLFFGLFSYGAIALPILMFVRAFMWKNDADKKCIGVRIIFSASFIAGISTLASVFSGNDFGFNLKELYLAGCKLSGGGAIGGLISEALIKVVGPAGTLIITFALVFICGLFMLGITPYMIWIRILYSIKKHREDVKYREAMLEEDERKQMRTRSEAVLTKKPPEKKPRAEIDKYDPVEDIDEPESEALPENDTFEPQPIDVSVWNEAASDEPSSSDNIESEDAPIIDSPFITPVAPEKAVPTPSRNLDPHSVDLDYIFGNGEVGVSESDAAFDEIIEDADEVDELAVDLTVERHTIGTLEEETEAPEAETHEYKFPPITLLKKDTSVKNQDITEELRVTANKLVETLKSYKINTRLISISRGPSITRYELSPEVGTKVNSIVNRIDDISLHLATTGVRIVAPIPGMEAVGVEVPNKTVSLVYIRELLENDEFKNHPSKIHVALGMDVTGKPIYMDIAKMPHLLIAGATGMGKSVCINSTIISILYKATPDEVKLILIDPKQVEFTMYDGIPHLLVPVVTDPKKAAGTLHWAVTEMERRYELINGAAVRNIHGYNEKMKNEPGAEYMPQIVIIIDELADLMLTASNDVDESIRRLSAKARAAGIHLILGTQRPSVDVITGTIKSNIPYRIAFTTTSYVDSRTILDIAGAEKLIGKGDMLYAATGKSPIRVQGSFVSDEEVGEIASFVKQNCGGANYNADVVECIEREAELCGNKKSTTLGDGDIENNSGDPLLKAAIEIAVDTGKISTSLLQRKLSIGFGRASKIIDIMQEKGIVSAPDGQKPRTTLWTKQQYMESIVKGSSYANEE